MWQRRMGQRPARAVARGLLALLFLLLTSCSLPANPFTHPTSVTPKRGGSITVALDNDPTSLLPNQLYQPISPLVDQAIWAPLWYTDPNGIMHPGLATAIPSSENGGVSADLRTWTIHLKPGLKWSDGSPLTAEDCAFSYNLYANPAYYNTAGFPTIDAKDPIGFESATATDPTMVILTLKRPFVGVNALLSDGSGSCLPKAVWSKFSPADIAKEPPDVAPMVTSGPFKVKEWVVNRVNGVVTGEHITVVRNPYYYLAPAKPYLDQVTFPIIPDDYQIAVALRYHQADAAVPLFLSKLDSFQSIPDSTTFIDPQPAGYEMLIFNLRDPILSDIRVRKALIASFDIAKLVPTLYNGAARLTCDDSGGTFAHEPSLVPCYHYDVAQAESLLDAAGWVMGADGYRHKDGKMLELDYWTGDFHTQEFASAEWKQVGIKIDAKVPGDNPFGGVFPLLDFGHFQIFELAGGPGYHLGNPFSSVSADPDDHTLFASDQVPTDCCASPAANYMHYSNPIVDTAEHQQLTSADPAARKAAFHTIHEQVLADAPVFYLYSVGNVFIHSNELCGTYPSPAGPTALWNVWDWNLGNSEVVCPPTDFTP